MTSSVDDFAFPATRIATARPEYGYLREPVIARLPAGGLICFMLSGGPREPDPSNIALVSRSFDDGATWTAPVPFMSHRARATWLTEVSVIDGVPTAFHHTYAAETSYQELLAFVTYGSADGSTWSLPVSLPGNAKNLAVRPGIELANGDLAYPVYWQRFERQWDWLVSNTDLTVINDGWPFRCGVIISSDRGKSFRIHGDIGAEAPLWEPALAQLDDGSLTMLMRAEGTGYLFRSDSPDGGLTWTDPVPTTIPNPGSKFMIVQVAGGHLLLNNPRPNTGNGFADRSPLTAWFSTDGFHTVQKETQLTPDDRPAFYPHAFADVDQQLLYVAFENAQEHFLMKVPLAELMP